MIYETLTIIQSRLNAPKSQYNKFGNYNYRSCEDILEALKPLLKETGACVIISDEPIVINDRYYIKATATLIKDGEQVSTTAYAREEDSKKGMDGSQVTGAASSYARKYALNGLFAIDDNKDSDTTNKGENNGENNGGTPPAAQKPRTASKPAEQSRLSQILDLLKGSGLSSQDVTKWILKKYHDPNLNVDTLSNEQYSALVEALTNARNTQKEAV